MPNYTLTAAQGSVALTGQTVAVKHAHKLTITRGLYVYTGFDRNTEKLIKLNRSRSRPGYPQSVYKNMSPTRKEFKLRWWRR